jgi:hypothetical protein
LSLTPTKNTSIYFSREREREKKYVLWIAVARICEAIYNKRGEGGEKRPEGWQLKRVLLLLLL